MIISDTSVITNLISIEHLFLLQVLYEKVIIPQAVYEELSRCHSLFLIKYSANLVITEVSLIITIFPTPVNYVNECQNPPNHNDIKVFSAPSTNPEKHQIPFVPF